MLDWNAMHGAVSLRMGGGGDLGWWSCPCPYWCILGLSFGSFEICFVCVLLLLLLCVFVVCLVSCVWVVVCGGCVVVVVVVVVNWLVGCVVIFFICLLCGYICLKNKKGP